MIPVAASRNNFFERLRTTRFLIIISIHRFVTLCVRNLLLFRRIQYFGHHLILVQIIATIPHVLLGRHSLIDHHHVVLVVRKTQLVLRWISVDFLTVFDWRSRATVSSYARINCTFSASLTSFIVSTSSWPTPATRTVSISLHLSRWVGFLGRN